MAATASVTFDFTGFSVNTSLEPGTYTSGGLTMTVSSNAVAQPNAVAERTSPSWIRGLGVVSGTSMDGSIQPGESLIFSIPAGYAVQNVDVSRHNNLEFQAFAMFADTNLVGGGTVTAVNDSNGVGSMNFAASMSSGSTFTITPNSSNTGGIWVNSITLAEASPVPLPAGILLLGGALAMGTAVSRKRAKAAA